MLDGIGDRSHGILGYTTPLQKARTPAMDKLARRGCTGLYHPGLCGQSFPSESSHFIIFGYDMDDFPGRGPLEALGAGIHFEKNDVVVLAHLACADEKEGNLILKEEKPDIGADEARHLYDSIKHYSRKQTEVTAWQIKGINGVIAISGGMSPDITDSDPVITERPVSEVRPWDMSGDAAPAGQCAQLMNSYLRWAYHVLSSSPVNAARKKAGLRPVNVMVTQRAGRLKEVLPLRERYGLRALSISSSTIYRGIGSCIGMDHVHCPSAPAAQDMEAKLRLALQKAGEYDLIHVHTKEPDEAAHQKNPLAKVRVIEEIDRGIKKALPELMKRDDLFIVVMADHSTPSDGPLIHSGEPVPVIFHGRGVRRDSVKQFDELSASRGALGLLRSNEMMLSILNAMDRSVLLGMRDSPADLPYWPGKPSPLKISEG